MLTSMLIVAQLLAEVPPPSASKAFGFSADEMKRVEAGELVEVPEHQGKNFNSRLGVVLDFPESQVHTLFADFCRRDPTATRVKVRRPVPAEAVRKLLSAPEKDRTQDGFRSLPNASCDLDNGELYVYVEVSLPFPLSDRWAVSRLKPAETSDGWVMESELVAGDLGAAHVHVQIQPDGEARTLYLSKSEVTLTFWVPDFLLKRHPTEGEKQIQHLREELQKLATKSKP